MAHSDNDDSILVHITSRVEKLEAELSNKDFPECEFEDEIEEILDSRIKDCDELLKELSKDKKEVSKTIDRIRADLIHLREDPEEQIRKLVQFEDELSIIVKDKDSMDRAREQVASITAQQFSDLKNLRRPPKVLEEVLIGIAYLFGVKPGESERRKSFTKKTRRKKKPAPAVIQWADAKRFMLKMETREKILRFNPLMCKTEDIEKARSWIKEHSESFNMERLRRASRSFAPLAAWINLSMELASKHKNTRDLDVKLIMLTEKTNEIRKQLARSKKDTSFIENMEKKVSGIYNKQVELEECVVKQKNELQKRRGNIPERRKKRESISLQHVDTLRGEYQTQIFFDWKTMMQDNKKKKKKKKKKKTKRKRKEQPKDDDEEVKLICTLTTSSKLNDTESDSETRKKNREKYMMQTKSKSIRKLTGVESEIKVWVEGEGWTIPDDEKKEDVGKTSSMLSIEEEKERPRPRHRQKRSAIIMKGLIKSLQSESKLRELETGNQLMKFLAKIRARLDKIDLELERQHST